MNTPTFFDWSDDPAIAVPAMWAPRAPLLAIAAGDLRQPLQAAMLSIVRAVEDGASPGAIVRLRSALDSLRRMGSDIETVVAQAWHGDVVSPETGPLRLDDLVGEVIRDWSVLAEACAIDFRIRLPKVHVRSNAALLRIALRNIVGNAIRFAGPAGAVEISARIRRNVIVIDIDDDGCGVADTRTGHPGSSVGRGEAIEGRHAPGASLQVAWQIARLLKHPVSLSTDENNGSTLSLALPLLMDEVS